MNCSDVCFSIALLVSCGRKLPSLPSLFNKLVFPESFQQTFANSIAKLEKWLELKF